MCFRVIVTDNESTSHTPCPSSLMVHVRQDVALNFSVTIIIIITWTYIAPFKEPKDALQREHTAYTYEMKYIYGMKYTYVTSTYM